MAGGKQKELKIEFLKMTLDINMTTAKWVQVEQQQLPILFLMTKHLGKIRHWKLRLPVRFAADYPKNCRRSSLAVSKALV